MFGLSLAELAVILTVALVVLGPDKLPEVVRFLGRAYGQLLKFKAEFTKTVEENIAPLDPTKWPENRNFSLSQPLTPPSQNTQVPETKVTTDLTTDIDQIQQIVQPDDNSSYQRVKTDDKSSIQKVAPSVESQSQPETVIESKTDSSVLKN
jgi:sec-independent protein translocase protein TatB